MILSHFGRIDYGSTSAAAAAAEAMSIMIALPLLHVQTSSFKSRVPKLSSKVAKFNVNYMTLDTPKLNTTFEDNFGTLD